MTHPGGQNTQCMVQELSSLALVSLILTILYYQKN